MGGFNIHLKENIRVLGKYYEIFSYSINATTTVLHIHLLWSTLASKIPRRTANWQETYQLLSAFFHIWKIFKLKELILLPLKLVLYHKNSAYGPRIIELS